MTLNKSTTAAIICLLAETNARITDNGLWDDADWYDSATEIGVTNGSPFSEDAAVARRINSPMATEGAVMDYLSFPNVQRVQTLFPEGDFDYVVPERNELYTYHGLLRAIAKFPAFCGENNMPGYTLDQTCLRELAVLFAHFNQETGQHNSNSSLEEWRQGLAHITEWACTPPQLGVGTASCDYKATWGLGAEAYPPSSGVQYYGRGPF